MEIMHLSQTLAAKLYLLEDTRKAAELLYEIVQSSLKSETEKQDAAKNYVIKTIEVISGIDSRYADKIAADYLNLVKDAMLRY